MNTYYVYIMSSGPNKTIYTGITSDIEKRVCQHKNKQNIGFTSKYGVDKLVYFEEFVEVTRAIGREKRIKKWNRQWKINLINSVNPEWKDYYKIWFPNSVTKMDPPDKPWDDIKSDIM